MKIKQTKYSKIKRVNFKNGYIEVGFVKNSAHSVNEYYLLFSRNNDDSIMLELTQEEVGVINSLSELALIKYEQIDSSPKKWERIMIK